MLTRRSSWFPLVRAALLLGACIGAASVARAEDKPEALKTFKHQVTGLFSPDRVADLEKAAANLKDVQLVKVDFVTAEAEFRYDPAKAFNNAPPEKIVEQFDNQIKQASRHTFGIKPLCTTPRDQLKLVKIEVLGVDCKACSLGAYEAIYKEPGVEQATASFKEGLVTAWIHPGKTEQSMLEEALLRRNVLLKSREGK